MVKNKTCSLKTYIQKEDNVLEDVPWYEEGEGYF